MCACACVCGRERGRCIESKKRGETPTRGGVSCGLLELVWRCRVRWDATIWGDGDGDGLDGGVRAEGKGGSCNLIWRWGGTWVEGELG